MNYQSKHLPPGWSRTRIGDFTAEKITQIKPVPPFNYIDISSINNTSKTIESPKKLTSSDTVPSRARQQLKSDDILVSMTRPNLNAVAQVPAEFNGSIASTGFHVLRPLSVSSDWLFAYVRSKGFVNSLVAQVQGALYPAIRPDDIRSHEIALPPLREQHRIVAKIESLQERSSRARAALAEVGPLLEQFRRSVLSAAFSGRLTTDWRAANPDVEPASELLHRIRTERRQRWEQAELAKYEAKGKKPPKDWQDKYKDTNPLTPTKIAALPSLPPTWQWEPFEAVATVDSNLVSPDDYPHHWHIAPDNIEKETGQLLSYRTVSDDKVISGKHLFFPGHILYSKIRPYLSKVVVVDFEGLCSADMYPIAPHLETLYLFHYMLSSQFLTHVQNQAGNRVVLPKVNQKQLCRVPVPVAPADEQIEIARRMNEATETFSELSGFLLDSKSALQKLDQSILAKAFRGELVPQDPADEPAAELLARIAAARAAATKKLNKRTRRPTKQK